MSPWFVKPIITAPDFACVLPVTGSKKNSYMPVRGRIIPNAAARKAKTAIVAEIKAAMWQARRAWPLAAPYRVWLYLPTAHRTDSDNSVGHALDCLTQCGVITDDAPITDLRIIREPRADIRLEVWGNVTDWRL